MRKKRKGCRYIKNTHFIFNSSFDNGKIASGGVDRTVLLWDVSSGEITRRYTAHWEVRK